MAYGFNITKLEGQTRVDHIVHERWNKKHTKVLERSEYDINKQAFEIRAFGETRTVWATFYRYENSTETRYHSEYVFASSTRYGSKLHRKNLTFEIGDDGKVSIYNSVALNRQAQIVGWWKPEYDAENGRGSKHIGG